MSELLLMKVIQQLPTTDLTTLYLALVLLLVSSVFVYWEEQEVLIFEKAPSVWWKVEPWLEQEGLDALIKTLPEYQENTIDRTEFDKMFLEMWCLKNILRHSNIMHSYFCSF